MSSNNTIHLVSHTHWDREWYFSTCDSLVLLDQTVRDILNELRDNPSVNFTLDGQYSILEDYLKLNPQDLEEIRTYVKQGRLFIGPWYTQTDTQLVAGNSIVNNMYYGIIKSQEVVGDYMKVGYLPDTFGFSNQMPMIMNQFGIDNMIFWRGANFPKQKIAPYFNWIGQDKSIATSVILHNGYGMAKGFNNSDIFMEKKLKPLVDEFKALTQSENILIPVGNDQNNIVVDLDQKAAIAGNEFKISSYNDFLDSIKDNLSIEYSGEFRETSYTRIHKSAGGIRLDIKHSNYIAEMALLKGLEPLNAMAKLDGMGVSNTLVYEAWKKLFEGQAHDGIVGCVSDSVAQDIVVRNKQALEIANSAQNYIKKQFSERIGLLEGQILLFNLEAKPFNGFKEVEIMSHDRFIKVNGVHSYSIIETQSFAGNPQALVERPEGNHFEVEAPYFLHKVLLHVELPSFGYKVFDFEATEDQAVKTHTQISNDKFTLELVEGKLRLTAGSNIIDDFITLVDDGNEGDTYDYSAILNDQPITFANVGADIEITDNNQRMIVHAQAKLPYDISDRMALNNEVEASANIIIDLRDGEGIRVKVEYDNTILNHRLRLKVKSNNLQPDTSLAATPFGTVTRPILNGVYEENWAENNVEMPIDLETNSGFVTLVGEADQLTVFNKGVKEYQVIEDSIYMTLFCSTDELGKPDLLYRPGRASGDTTKKGHIRMLTPMAQVLGEHSFEFMIDFMPNSDKALHSRLNEFETLSVAYQNQIINLFHERIDNKIQLIPSGITMDSEKSYYDLGNNVQVESIYNSLIDGKIKFRIISFEDSNKEDAGLSNYVVGNLLEEGNEDLISAYRLYTVREK